MAQKPNYFIFPFTFRRMPDRQLLLVNQGGEFLFISSEDFGLFINGALNKKSEIFLDLKSKHFLTDIDLETPINLLATKLRTKKGFLKNFTALHMIVVTTRCNFRCNYCHASSSSHQDKAGDMSWDTAFKTVNMIFNSPSQTIKIEFQGGEPLLNWKIVKKIIEYALFLNRLKRKNLEFVLCTNLTLIDESILKYLKKYRVLISTSLDGPKDLHNLHRVSRTGIDGYEIFKNKLNLCRMFIGQENISALLTVTKNTLGRWKEVIDEYLKLGFNDIFIRSINPYGRAKTEWRNIGYSIEEFIATYKKMLNYIIELNLEGKKFIEHYASLLLYRILTPFSTGFMDLQSPTGAGISGAIYDYNGDIYPSDEARMLARMGDKTFCMGNVHTNKYKEIFNGAIIRKIIGSSCVETLPGCASCAYQIFCGADPIRNYVETGDIVGYRPTSEFCKKNMEIIDYLFEIIRKNDEKVLDVFWSWITKRSLKEINE